MGNWQAESAFEPYASNPNGGAYGLAQWLGARQNALQTYCLQRGLDYPSLHAQLAFAWYEMTGGDGQWYAALQSAGGLAAWNAMPVLTAAEFFYNNYEVGGPSQVGSRYAYAQDWYTQWQQGNPFTSLPAASGGGGIPSESSLTSGISNNVIFPPTDYGVVANSQRTGQVLYGRRYRVVVSRDKGVALDVSDLHCAFDIQYTVNKQPPFCTITIYNLNPLTENFLLEYGNQVIVEAGYEGHQYGVIFNGELVEPVRDQPDNVTYRLTLNCLAGNAQANQAFAAFTLNKLQSARSIVTNLATKATVPTALGDLSPMLDGAKLPRAKTVFGLTRDVIRQIEQGNHLTAYYGLDGSLNIVHASDPATERIVDLTPESGLIGQPAQSGIGVSFQCLLNPNLHIGSMVHIAPNLIQTQTFQIGASGLSNVPKPLDSQGIYRVMSVEHVGDTRDTDWYTNCTTVSQAGSNPAILTNAAGNPYSG